MVWGVCRRVLPNYHDAEDAFQATFLVLVRKAARVQPKEMVANWLYGVAYHTALKARSVAGRRKGRERQVVEMPEQAVEEREVWHDLQPLLDQELSCLPDKYRVPIVLCDLEGKTRREAARQLGWPEGTVAGRLATARKMLARRLARRGVALSGGALAAVLSAKAASAGVPASVVSSTIKTATLVAAGQAAVTGVISIKVAALTEGVMMAMLMSKLKAVSTAVLIVCFLGIGATVFIPCKAAGQNGKAPGNEKQPAVADEQAPSYTIHVRELTAPEKVVRVPLASSMAILDAVKALKRSPRELAGMDLWIVRRKEEGTVKVLRVDWAAITQRGESATNYQMIAGDRLFLQARPANEEYSELGFYPPAKRLLDTQKTGAITKELDAQRKARVKAFAKLQALASIETNLKILREHTEDKLEREALTKIEKALLRYQDLKFAIEELMIEVEKEAIPYPAENKQSDKKK
jgi:RNA polymerase sigma factor (sigma-70 family)